MSFLSGLNTQNPNIQITDKLGSGGGFDVLTGLYTAQITAAYIYKLDGQAGRAEFEFKLKETGQKFSQGFNVTDEKGNHIYVDKEGAQKFVAGFLMVDSIAYLACKGASIGSLPTRDTVVAKRNYDTKQDEQLNVQELTDLIGKEVCLGILKQAGFKRVKNAQGAWEESKTETTVRSIIHTPFHSVKHFTYAEGRAAQAAGTTVESKFYDAWKAEWHDTQKVRDFTNGAYLNQAAQAATSMAAASPAAVSTPAPEVPQGDGIFN